MDTRAPQKQLSMMAVLKTLRRRWMLVVIPVVVITAAVAFYAKRMPNRYRARVLVATVQVTPEPYLSARPEPTVTANVQEQLRTIRETLLGSAVLNRVIRDNNLYPVTAEGASEQSLDAMRSMIQVQVEAPDAFYVGFEADRPQKAAEVANQLANLFVQQTSTQRGRRVEQVGNVLDSEVERLRKQLTQQEDSLSSYKQSMAQELPDRLATNLKQLETLQLEAQNKTDQIIEGQAKRMAMIEEMQALEKQGALDPAPRQKTPNETSLEALRAKLRQLKTQYTPEFPEIQRTEKEIHDLEAAAAQNAPRSEPSPLHMRYIALQAELKSLEQRLKNYQQERAALSSQITVNERKINATPGLESTIGQRMRDISVTRSQYEAMLAKQQAEKLDQRVERSDNRASFRIAEPARVPATPYSPQRIRMVLMALVASLGVGFGCVLLVEQMDSSFDTIEEFQGFTNIPVLSAVPTIFSRTLAAGSAKNGGRDPELLEAMRPKSDGVSPEQRQHFQKHRLAVLGDPQSIPAQQFGILTLKIQRWAEQSGGRVLVVTSAAGGEGKSLTALNLSMALASSVEGRVLLVDCDLRRPQVRDRLGLNGNKGLSDLLAQPRRDELEPYITRVGNLWVMTGGTMLRDPEGLQSSRKTAELIARLREQFQFVVLDSPPIVPIADSHYLAGLADGVLMVVRARQTPRELLQRAIESLGAANIVGVVLNDVEYGDTRYAYAYRYYQRHYLDRR